MTKRTKRSALTRAALAGAVVLGLGVGAVATIGAVGPGAKPVPAGRSAVLDFGSLSQNPADNPFGPALVEKKVHRGSADQRKAGKPKQRKPGQRNQARPGSNRLPGVGRPCGERQVNRIRNGVRGKVVCARMGSGAHRWVQINGVDPQARKPATKCTGQYITARGPNGRAMQCTRGRWTYDR
ncbi:MAG TPA: hypothetical protein PK331_03975 [Gordonia sp. (in: high G+C Gram-positive bacteria)]|uniref:hypothetical protein n=1 Tax=unclassified Gordonia (in: high G+C Gram-positive bacteria) TaxID=2657482 RepID=UPI0025B9D5AF|nr:MULTISPECIES: hypothetical protein [unclassified Gordonia (in: high G+C Gram-positive bacteria)]HNP55357.1 hypothetical protein [Gordonia sp. (in: high G+C Gram-positive bacteria)]HRC50071.1 hypothetical protein [Gordonia sp. (in: high G+C Gram-positive bacteria)]